MKKHTLKHRLALRSETVKTLAGRELERVGGAKLGDTWWCTLWSYANPCPSDECSFDRCGGGGGTPSGVRCPK